MRITRKEMAKLKKEVLFFVVVVLAGIVISGCEPVVDEKENVDVSDNGLQEELSEEIQNESLEEKEEPVSDRLEFVYYPDSQVIAEKEIKYKKAPELTGLVGFINTEEDISLESLKGSVVLIDFWTYSCHNCQATLPYVTRWHSDYKDEGLVVIGIHTPEFQFEYDIEGVKDAMEKYGIEYAVVQDNNKKTWRAYQNRFWPRKYLIDIDGFIRYDKIGEGGYIATESMIKELLNERTLRIEKFSEEEQERSISENIQLGFGDAKDDSIPVLIDSSVPAIVKQNEIHLEGEWFLGKNYVESASDKSRVVVAYTAEKVVVEAESTLGKASIDVNHDSVTVHSDIRGADIVESVVDVDERKEYEIINSDPAPGLLEFKASQPGFRLHAVKFE